MSYKELVIIDNEKISKKSDNFYCDNFEAKISEDFEKVFNVTVIARKSKINRANQINLEKIEIASNIFSFLFKILKTFKKNKTNYLIIAINPYTFFACLFLLLFRKKIFVYLRSDGHEEYKAILGFIGPIIYNVMFKIVTFKTNVITCQKRLFTKGKSDVVFPSEINSFWIDNKQAPLLDMPRLLYVGRVKVEKGIFSLLKIFDQIKIDSKLSIIGRVENVKSNNKKVSFVGPIYDSSALIKIYDNHNIFILPSFTEAHPKVIDESLARVRPVIIFDEINHIIQNRKGIFVSKRNAKSLLETINFIMKNYQNIQQSILENKLPTKQEFISKMNNILQSN
jgi:glycosyltransferase involved in cell wall biosynthesis